VRIRYSQHVFTSILCPIDFSTDSRAALRYAFAVARRSRGSVTALHVADPFLINAAAAAYGGRSRFVRHTREEGRRFVAAVARQDRAKPGAFRLAEGDPAREILTTCTSLRADLVVIGTHGLGGVGKFFFGSTTARVLARTQVPVLAVPASRRRRTHARPGPTWPDRRIVVPLTLDRTAGSHARQALDVARFFGASVLLVHAVPRPQVPPFMGTGFFERERATLARAHGTLERLAGRLPPDVAREVMVAAGDPADVVATVARRSRSGLVVLTLARRPGPFGSAQGTISYRVLRRGVVPVLALPARWRR
jgi:nucleotide-binding universal stress UspA family protein